MTLGILDTKSGQLLLVTFTAGKARTVCVMTKETGD